MKCSWPPEWEAARKAALFALEHAGSGELGPEARSALWRQVGPKHQEDAWRVRIQLARLTLQRVMHLWSGSMGSQIPALVLTELHAHSVVNAEARRRYGAWQAALDDLVVEASGPDIWVGYCALRAYEVALWDYWPTHVGAVLDTDLDPYEWDCSFYASMAYAGGAWWDEASSKTKRVEFWTWWLEEAVPEEWGNR